MLSPDFYSSNFTLETERSYCSNVCYGINKFWEALLVKPIEKVSGASLDKRGPAVTESWAGDFETFLATFCFP